MESIDEQTLKLINIVPTLKPTCKFLTFLSTAASQPKLQFPQLTHRRDASEQDYDSDFMGET